MTETAMAIMVGGIENFIKQRYFVAARDLTTLLPEPERTEWLEKIRFAEKIAEILEDGKKEFMRKISERSKKRAAWLKRNNKPCRKTLL